MNPPVLIPTLPGAAFGLPPQLEGLRSLSYNLWWSWTPRARALFSRIDGLSWSRYRNPVEVLSQPIAWSDLLDDPAFMAECSQVLDEFKRYMAGGRDHWFNREHNASLTGPIAYLCAEYAFHESLGVYSGGLGVLAGDHIKTASDMAMPFVGVGLLYKHGYFRQTIDADGHQEHAYLDYDLARLPILRVLEPAGDPLTLALEVPGRDIWAAVWLVQVGRVPVLLLDTDIPDNAESDRPVTHQLYVRGRRMRLYQEIVLGVGGIRALDALGIRPAVWHLNESNAALSFVERGRVLCSKGVPIDDALEALRDTTVFTVHAATAAGDERFDTTVIEELLGQGTEEKPDLVLRALMPLAEGPYGPHQFDLTALALRLSCRANATSHLHATTANTIYFNIRRSPLLAVTNGIHLPTWVGQPMRDVYERYLGADLDNIDTTTSVNRSWERTDKIPDVELWESHQRQKLELMIFTRNRLRHQFSRHGESPEVLEELEDRLDMNALTIGFARRFTTYKRASLLLSDMDRLSQILWNPQRPVQVIFAGKAHPADRPGQGVIQEIFARSRSPRLRGRVFILEDYDMRVARFMVQGVDVWLNNPRRPLESSGTSGMKAACNGVLNLSVLDGWWDEGWTGDNGWAIGGREVDPDEDAQDHADAQDLYRLLEEEVVPLWFARNESDIPEGWTAQMRRSIATTMWRFSTTRMLHEYVEQMYLHARST
jgi:starch phosphorylase